MLTVNEASGFGSGGGAGGRADVGDAPQTNLKYHFRADVGVTDSSGVEAWLDQQGTGESLDAATTHKPTYNASATVGTLINAGAIECNGSTNDLSNTTMTTTNHTFDMFVVFQQKTWVGSAGQDDVLTYKGTGEAHFAQVDGGTTPELELVTGIADSGSITDFALSTWALAILAWDGPDSSLARNDDSPNANSAGSNDWAMTTGMTLGASGRPGNYAWLHGDFAELLIYDAHQSGAALTAIKNYINGQYGLW